jgi:hypothetical protein
MSTTARDAIAAALRLIGALAPSESLPAQEASDGLATFNRMLDSWSNDKLLLPSIVRDELTLTPGTGSYTMGTGGTFNVARPMEIVEALFRMETVTPALEIPIKVLDLEQWATVAMKDVSNSISTMLFDDGGYPFRTLKLWPIPSVANKLVIYSKKPLASLASIDAVISLPPGYEEGLIYSLAMRLAPEYGKMPSDIVVAVSTKAEARLKRENYRPDYMRVDTQLSGHGGSFNWIKGDTV